MWTLERYYFFKQWYEHTKGIVEYLAEWASATHVEDAAVVGGLIVIVLALIIAWRSARFFKSNPEKAETIACIVREWWHGKEK